MKRSTTVLLLTVYAALFAGCSNKPSDETTRNLVSQYLEQSPSMTGGLKVPKEKIKVSNSYDKDGRKVMVVRVGGMVCDMPVIKGDKDWMATGISCNGSVYTPEEAAQEQKKEGLEYYEKAGDELKKKGPQKVGAVQVDSITVKGDTVTIETSVPGVTAAQLDEKKKAVIANEAQNSVLADYCNDDRKGPMIKAGATFIANLKAADKTPILTASADKAKCETYFSKHPVVSAVDNQAFPAAPAPPAPSEMK